MHRGFSESMPQGGSRNKKYDLGLFRPSGLTLLCNQAHIYIRKYDIIIDAVASPRCLASRTKPFPWFYLQLNTSEVIL
jgi:hypothetical protein